MSITVPGAGDPITVADFGQPVAEQLNQMILLQVSADVSKTSNAFSDVTGLTFPVTNGKTYTLDLSGHWAGDTSTGISLGYALTTATGTAHLIVMLHTTVPSSAVAPYTERVNSTDTMTGVSAATTSAMGWRIYGSFVCTADGTFAIRYKRNGTSTTVTIYQGSGGLVIASA